MFSSLPADNNEVNRNDNIKEKQEYLEYENSCRFIRRLFFKSEQNNSDSSRENLERATSSTAIHQIT
ncbi:hypothetical protein OUZ56_001944 [Daphnia magna]|uniref:Uncharacterized protein n=1 Tax=Daphnia magna TaxID=35525 RepID=A0ABR0A482_9CRUS|nr:hypothetical protein OUZ56_001944 [Daphnia magna]